MDDHQMYKIGLEVGERSCVIRKKQPLNTSEDKNDDRTMIKLTKRPNDASKYLSILWEDAGRSMYVGPARSKISSMVRKDKQRGGSRRDERLRSSQG